VRRQYLVHDGHDAAANRDSLDKVCGDRSFTCPTKELTDMYSRRAIHTYFYYLSYRASTEVWPDWMGVIHGADIQARKRSTYIDCHAVQSTYDTELWLRLGAMIVHKIF